MTWVVFFRVSLAEPPPPQRGGGNKPLTETGVSGVIVVKQVKMFFLARSGMLCNPLIRYDYETEKLS
jgi:hypothetical protein